MSFALCLLASAPARQMRDAAAWTAAERAISNACPTKSAALRMREFSPTYIAPSIVMAGSDMAARLGESMTTPENPSNTKPSTYPFDWRLLATAPKYASLHPTSCRSAAMSTF